jgi:hypothetical protein
MCALTSCHIAVTVLVVLGHLYDPAVHWCGSLSALALTPLLSVAVPASCSRFDSNSGANNAEAELDSPTAASIIESQLVRREGSMHLPRPADCNVQGTHSDMCIVRVRRNHLLEDALDEIARQYRWGGGAVTEVVIFADVS